MSSTCTDEELANLLPRINELWLTYKPGQGPEIRAQLAELAESIAAELDELAMFYRQRAEILRIQTW